MTIIENPHLRTMYFVNHKVCIKLYNPNVTQVDRKSLKVICTCFIKITACEKYAYGYTVRNACVNIMENIVDDDDVLFNAYLIVIANWLTYWQANKK